MTTNADGVAYLRRLPTRQNVSLAVDPTTLEDPQWSLALQAFSSCRERDAAELDFPVIMTGEIDGTVYVVTQDRLRPG